MDHAATRDEALARIAAAQDLGTLEALRVEFLGKQGSISGLLKTLGGMSPDERQQAGPQIHALREAVTEESSCRTAPAAVLRGLTKVFSPFARWRSFKASKASRRM